MNIFPKDYFDYIIIDEVHHGGAKTYQSIFEYFKPKFLLGITATPEEQMILIYINSLITMSPMKSVYKML